MVKMTTEQKAEWQKIEKAIYAAFKEVRLGDGIGYYEAGALDDYLGPSDTGYQIEKARDEREDWTRLLSAFRHISPQEDRHCFMDAPGLRFYLPFLLIRQDPAVNGILYFYISQACHRPGYPETAVSAMVAILTKDQKHCIYRFYDFLNQFEGSDFDEESLNSPFETGEEALKGFDYMTFIKDHFRS